MKCQGKGAFTSVKIYCVQFKGDMSYLGKFLFRKRLLCTCRLCNILPSISSIENVL